MAGEFGGGILRGGFGRIGWRGVTGGRSVAPAPATWGRRYSRGSGLVVEWAAAVGGVGKPRARAPPWAGLHLTLGSLSLSLSLGPVRLDGRVGSDYEGPLDKTNFFYL